LKEKLSTVINNKIGTGKKIAELMMKQKLQPSRTLVMTWCFCCAQRALQVACVKCCKQPKSD